MMTKVALDTNTYKWSEDCLTIPLAGFYDAIRIHETLCSIQTAIQNSRLPYWTRMIEYLPCVNTDPSSVQAAIDQLGAFHEWAKEKGCYASAVVLPRDRIEEFSHVHALADDAHNGVRVFFDKEQAEQWLIHQRQQHRRKRLH